MCRCSSVLENEFRLYLLSCYIMNSTCSWLHKRIDFSQTELFKYYRNEDGANIQLHLQKENEMAFGDAQNVPKNIQGIDEEMDAIDVANVGLC